MDAILQNIFEQAEVIHELNARYLARAEAFAQLAGRHFHRIMITGMGTSYFGGYPAFLYLQEHGLHNVLYVDASELLHYQMTTIADDTLLILISQSGESFEIVHILERIKKSGYSSFYHWRDHDGCRNHIATSRDFMSGHGQNRRNNSGCV